MQRATPWLRAETAAPGAADIAGDSLRRAVPPARPARYRTAAAKTAQFPASQSFHAPAPTLGWSAAGMSVASLALFQRHKCARLRAANNLPAKLRSSPRYA